MTVACRGATAVACRLTGVIESIHMEWMLAELDRQLAAGVTVVLIDASGIPSLGGGPSRALGAWATEQRAVLGGVHLLLDTELDEALEALVPILEDRWHHWHEAEAFAAALHDHAG